MAFKNLGTRDLGLFRKNHEEFSGKILELIESSTTQIQPWSITVWCNSFSP